MHGAAIFVWSVVDGLSRGVLDEVVLSVSLIHFRGDLRAIFPKMVTYWNVGHVNGDVRITVVSEGIQLIFSALAFLPRLEVEDTESVHLEHAFLKTRSKCSKSFRLSFRFAA